MCVVACLQTSTPSLQHSQQGGSQKVGGYQRPGTKKYLGYDDAQAQSLIRFSLGIVLRARGATVLIRAVLGIVLRGRAPHKQVGDARPSSGIENECPERERIKTGFLSFLSVKCREWRVVFCHTMALRQSLSSGVGTWQACSKDAVPHIGHTNWSAAVCGGGDFLRPVA